VFSTGHGRKTDATDAHAIAVVAVRTPSLTPVSVDDELVAFAAAGRPPRRTCRRPHPHGVPAAPAATRAHPRWRTPIPVRHPSQSTPGHGPTAGWPGRTRRRLAAELLAVIVVLDRKLKDSDRRLTEAVAATGSRLPDLYGIGPVGAARILGDVSNIARFQTKAHFASWTGTAPIDASSGQQQRHRLSRAGNRRLNRVLHIMAIVQIRHDTEGRDYYRRKLAAGKIPMEAMRCPKRRLSDAVYRQLLTDSQPNHPAVEAGPGGHSGATLPSSAADLTPHIGTSDQPQPEPAPPTLPGPQPTRHPSGVSLTARPNRRPKPRP
jgi:transposase